MSEAKREPAGVSLWAIFRVFVVIGATAFGGGASGHIHDAVVVRKKWLDETRMLEALTIARIVPGTNVSNLAAFVGSLLAGYKGAAVAVFAVVLPGLVAVLGLAVAYVRFAGESHRIQTALLGLTAGAVGIMASLVINAARPALASRAGALFAVAAFVGVALLEINMLAVLVVLVPLASFVERGAGRS